MLEPLLLLLSFDLLLDLGPLLSGDAFLFVTLLLTLSWGQVVSGLPLATLGRSLLLGRFRFLRALSELVHLLDFNFNGLLALVETFLLLVIILKWHLLSGSFDLVLGTVIRRGRGTASESRDLLRELSVVDRPIGIVVAPAQDGLDIFATRIETIPLAVGDQVRHRNALGAPSELVEGTRLEEVAVLGKLALGLVASSLKLHLLLEEASEARQDLVGERLRRPEVGRVPPCGGHVTQVWVR